MLKKIALFVFVLIATTCSNIALTITAAKDDNAPVISYIKVVPDSGPVGTRYKIFLHITDPQGPDDIIKTLYQARERTEIIELTINDSGANDDEKSGDGIYTGKSFVPKSAAKQKHLFEVFVLDKERHKSNILKYYFTVLDGAKII